MILSRDFFITAVAPVAWGTTYTVTTQLLPPNHPLLDATVRALPIGLAMLAFTRELPHGAWWGRALILGTLNIAVYFGLLFFAAYRLPGGIASTVGAIAPFAVAFLSWPVLGRRPHRTQVLAALAGVLGVALIVAPRGGAGVDVAGAIAMAVATILMALGAVLTKRWAADVAPVVHTAWQLTAGGVLLLPLTFVLEPLPATITVANMAGFAYIGIVGTALAYVLYFRGIAKLSATSVTFLVLIAPLVATIMGRIVLNQTLAPLQIVGAIVVLAAVVAGQRETPATALRAREEGAA